MNKHLVFQSLRAPKTNYAATAMEIDYQAFDESHALGIKYSNLLLSVSWWVNQAVNENLH